MKTEKKLKIELLDALVLEFTKDLKNIEWVTVRDIVMDIKAYDDNGELIKEMLLDIDGTEHEFLVELDYFVRTVLKIEDYKKQEMELTKEEKDFLYNYKKTVPVFYKRDFCKGVTLMDMIANYYYMITENENTNVGLFAQSLLHLILNTNGETRDEKLMNKIATRELFRPAYFDDELFEMANDMLDVSLGFKTMDEIEGGDEYEE